MYEAVDPFIGTEVTDLPTPDGLAATWWRPKPQIGNTHPGATYPFGMVSACAYSGAYPTGYGLYDKATEGLPTALHDRQVASGFTHFQQSGTGAIRKYYNYVRVTPMLEPLDGLGTEWALRDERAEPGYYRARLANGIDCELTVGPKSAIHRYTFPAHRDARVVLDVTSGGLAIEHGRTVPSRAHLQVVSPGVAQGEIVVEGVPLAIHVECDTPEWKQMLWYDRRLMAGGSRLDFDSIRQTTLRPFGILLLGPTESGQSVELRIGFSLRGVEQAERNLHADLESHDGGFDERRSRTRSAWRSQLDTIRVEGGSTEQRATFATAHYHAVVKPCLAPDESPFWPMDGAFAFDIATMWDIYKTQLPLLSTIAPDVAVELVQALVQVAAEEGNLPIGYRMSRGADRFFRQASALAHTFFADVCDLGLPGIDWEWALLHMHTDLRRFYGEEYLEHGVAHPVSHTLDLAIGYHCTAKVARHVDDHALADQLDALAGRWRNAFDRDTGLLIDSTFYEGGRWNYSFRLLHDMASRIELVGGEEPFVDLLDQFFGVGAGPVKQLGEAPSPDEVAAGYALNRFEGLNNEPDMEAPWAYHWAGRTERTAEIVHAILTTQFGVGRGGLPGNEDSGGLSSWYVWASLGLFPVAGLGIFLINAPAFRRTRMRTGTSDVVIDTTGFVEPFPGGPVSYVQNVHIDGRQLDRSWIANTELHDARRIQIDLGPEPSDWAATTRPPSKPTTNPALEVPQ
ncbi:MAG: glycoside hydrolase domain-containing protein [Actinomycetota bacterium]